MQKYPNFPKIKNLFGFFINYTMKEDNKGSKCEHIYCPTRQKATFFLFLTNLTNNFLVN